MFKRRRAGAFLPSLAPFFYWADQTRKAPDFGPITAYVVASNGREKASPCRDVAAVRKYVSVFG